MAATSKPPVMDVESTAMPRLRFPEFRPGWQTKPLNALAKLITERAGDKAITPYTVTTGIGLVSQQERYGRTIAGNAFKNYYVIQKNDFAYNKSATKAYPQGYIARFVAEGLGAVPNSIFTCFRANTDVVCPEYLGYLFAGNLHGRWLRQRIEVSARAHGSLSVDDADLMALPVPVPEGAASRDEQQKIADCLTSLDDAIASQRRKVEALKAHKKGLLQHLFPQEGQTLPRLRFPEFRGGPEWVNKPLGEIAEIKLGKMLDGTKHAGGQLLPYLNNLAVRWNEVDTSKLPQMYFDDDELERFNLRAGDVLVCEGGEPGRSAVWDGRVPEMKFQKAIHRVRFNVPYTPQILVHYLETIAGTPRFEALFTGGGIQHLTRETFALLPVPVPNRAEQQRIADCLASLDETSTAALAALTALKTHKQGLMQALFPATKE